MERFVAEDLFIDWTDEGYDEVESVENGDLVNTYIFHQDDDKYVLQFPRNDLRGFEVGMNLYEDLRSSNIPVPEVKSREIEERNHAIMEYVPGNDLSDLENPDEELFYESGEILAEIHNEYSFDNYGFMAPKEITTHRGTRSWDRFFEGYVNARLNDLEGDFIDGTQRSEFDRILSKAPRKPENCLLHNDFSGRNIRVSSGVKAVIDFDSAIAGDPEFEFVVSRLAFEDDFDQEKATRFERGYRSKRETPRDFDELERVYEIAGFLDEAWCLKRLDELGREDNDREEIEKYISSARELC